MVQGIRVLNLIIKGALNTRALSKCISIHEGRRRRALCIHATAAADAHCRAQGQGRACMRTRRGPDALFPPGRESKGAPGTGRHVRLFWLVLLMEMAETVIGAQIEHERNELWEISSRALCVSSAMMCVTACRTGQCDCVTLPSWRFIQTRTPAVVALLWTQVAKMTSSSCSMISLSPGLASVALFQIW